MKAEIQARSMSKGKYHADFDVVLNCIGVDSKN